MRTSYLNNAGPGGARGLSGFALKGLAMCSMTIDHAAAVLLQNGAACAGRPALAALYFACRGVGRLAFPLYCFLLAEGFANTASRWAYARRLAVFALLSEAVFDLAIFSTPWYPHYQNVFFTLLLGLLALCALHAPAAALRWTGPPACVLAAEALRTDYGGFGVLLILVFSLWRKNRTPPWRWPRRRCCCTAPGTATGRGPLPSLLSCRFLPTAGRGAAPCPGMFFTCTTRCTC